MLSLVTIPLAVPEPDLALNVLINPLFYMFLLLLIILIAVYLFIYALELRFNNKIQELRSRLEQLETNVKEIQSLVERSREDLDSKIGAIEARLTELARLEQLEKEIKEAQSVVEKNREDLDGRIKVIETNFSELSSRVEELEKRSSRRSRKTTN